MTLPASGISSRRLVLRLSSLGDVVLATAILNTELFQSSQADWVVSAEYRGLLEGNPRISKVWAFDRKSGLGGWIECCRKLWEQQYDEVYDLHCSLRSRLAYFLFVYWCLKAGRRMPVWKRAAKDRAKLYGYFALKGAWPRVLRPERQIQKFAAIGSRRAVQTARTDLGYLVSGGDHLFKDEGLRPVLEAKEEYLCVMPGSLWPGKRWPVSRFAEVIQGLQIVPVVMGTLKDLESLELVQVLKKMGVRHVSGVGRWTQREVAWVMARSRGYLGNDSGLAHIAEAVGVPAYMVFGPTTPEMGFGPWRPESRALGAKLWCRPCGKDGRYCFRIHDRFACLRALGVQEVLAELPKDIVRSREGLLGLCHVNPSD